MIPKLSLAKRHQEKKELILYIRERIKFKDHTDYIIHTYIPSLRFIVFIKHMHIAKCTFSHIYFNMCALRNGGTECESLDGGGYDREGKCSVCVSHQSSTVAWQEATIGQRTLRCFNSYFMLLVVYKRKIQFNNRESHNFINIKLSIVLFNFTLN